MKNKTTVKIGATTHWGGMTTPYIKIGHYKMKGPQVLRRKTALRQMRNVCAKLGLAWEMDDAHNKHS